ncbi:MAG: hypothetical protein MUF38_16420 [Anaerolineae bacterium]|jgi:hypothetical protein|nr:hypothetical protein [Anaerolineae bacterium]
MDDSTHDLAGYRLCLQGHHDGFDGLSLTRHSDGTTTLYGVVDQAALHGVLRKIRDTGIVLISVMRVEPGQDIDASTGA